MTRHRQEIVLPQIIGNYKIKERSERIHRNKDYYYIGECLLCGHISYKIMWNFRHFSIHHCSKKIKYTPAYKVNLGKFSTNARYMVNNLKRNLL